MGESLPTRPVRYSDEDVKAILEHALDLEGKEFSRADLVTMATQLGISKERLAAAENTYFEARGDDALRQTFIRERRQKFNRDLAGFLVVLVLIYLAFVTDIFILPAVAVIAAMISIFVGLRLIGEGIKAYVNTVGDDFEKALDDWLDKREERRERRRVQLQ